MGFPTYKDLNSQPMVEAKSLNQIETIQQ